MRKLVFWGFIVAALLVTVLVCSIIWQQQRDQLHTVEHARELAAELARRCDAYASAHGGEQPASLEVLQQWQPAGFPINPETGAPLNQVTLLHNDYNFDVTLLKSRCRPAQPQGAPSQELAAPLIIVFGPPFYRGQDIDGDGLLDSVLAYYPPGSVDAEGLYGEGSQWIREAVGVTVRREEERLRKLGDRGQEEKGGKVRY